MKRVKRMTSFLVLLTVTSSLLTSCATIVSGRYQTVPISSSPSGACVFIDNQPVGCTPLKAVLSRKDDHLVVVNLEGYEPFEIYLTKGLNGWVFGNLLFGGLVGVGVDVVSGSVYKFDPKQLDIQMRPEDIVYRQETTKGCFAMVNNPSEEWELIGHIEKK